jgi:hypothetical protein
MTESTAAHLAPPDDVDRARRSAHAWGWSLVASVIVALAAFALLFNTTNQQGDQLATQGSQITELAQVIDRQNDLYGQVCRLAGGQVDSDPTAKEACARVQRGEQAVPAPAAAAAVIPERGADGIGIRFTRQIDRCYVEVGLTNGALNRFGSFCGDPGPTGESGEPGDEGERGPTGKAGLPGAPGVGVADVRANGCFAEVTLTDGTARSVGPFCGAPVGEWRTVRPDGSVEHCARDGGADTAPNYACTVVSDAPSTTETTPTPTS